MKKTIETAKELGYYVDHVSDDLTIITWFIGGTTTLEAMKSIMGEGAKLSTSTRRYLFNVKEFKQ